MTTSTDRYELFESLGRSDYLTIYRGWDRELRRFVAVMELDPGFRANPQQYDQIWDEVRSIVSVEHYALVRVYEIDKSHGWIITELMRSNVSEQITKKGLDSRQVRSILRIGLAALECLHGHGKLHGDVRPQNILIDDEGYVRVSHPIGLSVGGQIPRRKMNQKYLAPELVKPEFGEPGPATDLYCLGFTAYELLVGPAFDDRVINVKDISGSGNTVALSWLRWHAALETHLPPLKEMAPNTHDDVAQTIDQLVAKHVADRIESAGAALRLLRETNPEETVFDNLVELPRSERQSTKDSAAAPRLISPGVGDAAFPRSDPGFSTYSGKPKSPKPKAMPTKSKAGSGFEATTRNPWIFRCVSVVVLLLAAFIGLALQPKSTDSAADLPASRDANKVPAVAKSDQAPNEHAASLLHDEIVALTTAVTSNTKSQESLVPMLDQVGKSMAHIPPSSDALAASGKTTAKLIEKLESLSGSVEHLESTLQDIGEQQQNLITALQQARGASLVTARKIPGSIPDEVSQLPRHPPQIAPSSDSDALPENIATEQLADKARQKLDRGDIDGAIVDFESLEDLHQSLNNFGERP